MVRKIPSLPPKETNTGKRSGDASRGICPQWSKEQGSGPRPAHACPQWAPGVRGCVSLLLVSKAQPDLSHGRPLPHCSGEGTGECVWMLFLHICDHKCGPPGRIPFHGQRQILSNVPGSWDQVPRSKNVFQSQRYDPWNRYSSRLII